METLSQPPDRICSYCLSYLFTVIFRAKIKQKAEMEFNNRMEYRIRIYQLLPNVIHKARSVIITGVENS